MILVSQPKIDVESGYETFIPKEFKQDPLGYFESNGQKIKPGKINRDEAGKIREDPTAVKELPVWVDANGNKLRIIGKRVNLKKGEIGKSGDPFYEYRILQLINKLNLPAPKPILKVKQQNRYLILMEKVKGVGWYKRDALKLENRGYTKEDIENLKRQAEGQMKKLRKKFEGAGFQRGWKLKDMVFDIDIGNKKIKSIIPTDWERTKVDSQKVERYKHKFQTLD